MDDKQIKIIIQEIIKGNKEKFRLLMNANEALVRHIVHTQITNKTDRDELTQEIFYKIYKNLSTFKFKAKFSTWIGQIAHNTCINYNVKHKPVLYDDLDENSDNLYFLHSTEPASDYRLQEEDVSNIIRHEIQHLPVIYKTIVTLYHLDEMKYEDIAEVLNIPVGTVKSYLFRARKILKERLIKHWQGEELCQNII